MKANPILIIFLIIIAFFIIKGNTTFLGSASNPASISQISYIPTSFNYRGNLYADNKIAQTFTVTNSFTLTDIGIYTFIVGNPKKLKVELEELSDFNDINLISSVISSGEVQPTNNQKIEIPVTPILLKANTKYAIILSSSSSNSTDYVQVGGAISSPDAYVQGALLLPNGIYWRLYSISVTADIYFEIWGTTNAPVCTPSWSCSAWSACSGNTQTRTCTDANVCGVNTGKPAESQSCSVACANYTYYCSNADIRLIECGVNKGVVSTCNNGLACPNRYNGYTPVTFTSAQPNIANSWCTNTICDLDVFKYPYTTTSVPGAIQNHLSATDYAKVDAIWTYTNIWRSWKQGAPSDLTTINTNDQTTLKMKVNTDCVTLINSNCSDTIDTTCDGVSSAELGQAVSQWLSGSMTRSVLGGYITRWANDN